MHDLIEQIEDARLRERLRQEWEASVREKKFGLVFEPHLPELLPLPKVKPRRGDLVCMREGSLKDLWRVRRVANGVAFCVKPGAEGQGGPIDPVQFSLDELLVVRQFGEPIFPALVPVDQVQNGEAGFAKFAEQHGALFGRIEMLRAATGAAGNPRSANGGWMWTREQVIASIDAKTNTFFVTDPVSGKRADIGVVREAGKAPYVRTHADGRWNNNLLSLNQCSLQGA